MFGKFAAKVQGAGGRGDRKYELNEVLAILQMIEDGVSKEDICTLTGRTKDSLNYKIFEGQTTINGKTNVRSVKKFWYKDPKVKGSEQLSMEEGLRALYKHYNIDVTKLSQEELFNDAQSRIESFAGVEAATDEAADEAV